MTGILAAGSPNQTPEEYDGPGEHWEQAFGTAALTGHTPQRASRSVMSLSRSDRTVRFINWLWSLVALMEWAMTRSILLVMCTGLGWLGVSALADEPECLITKQGGRLCAPAAGIIIRTENGGVVCAPGHCEKDRHGHMKCARTASGSVSVTPAHEVQCQGGCVFPSVATCTKPGGG